MKITIQVDENINEEEIIIKCKDLRDDVYEIQNQISRILSKGKQIVFYKEDTEYFIPLNDILFFETEGEGIFGHSREAMYQVRYRLYELEEILPFHFIRISKSTILNVQHVKSINRNILSSSTVEFQKTHKKTYVSRHYYKDFKKRLMEVRGYYEK